MLEDLYQRMRKPADVVDLKWRELFLVRKDDPKDDAERPRPLAAKAPLILLKRASIKSKGSVGDKLCDCQRSVVGFFKIPYVRGEEGMREIRWR